jgi:hypothetical protein
MRNKRTEKFGHELIKAWDVPGPEGRTVIFESVSTTRFKGDDMDVLVNEMGMWELEKVDEEWKLVKARFWMDPGPVSQRAQEFFGQK